MPAASCRSMPARSIRRCDTISASFGFSFRMGRKNRDNRMGDSKEVSIGVRAECRSSETGSAGKTQDREFEKAAKFTDFLPFSAWAVHRYGPHMQNRTGNIYLLVSSGFSHSEKPRAENGCECQGPR